MTLLPDREPTTAQAWLAHPTIAIVARDRGGEYGEAAAKPSSRRPEIDASDPPRHRCDYIGPNLLTAAERLKYEGYCQSTL
ncbi:hypothetical protein I6F21_36410 [Bradyrhizobium sp. NBAIM03]|nr:hypothetical protein [Bradyrhizobium sp. NBAIM03]